MEKVVNVAGAGGPGRDTPGRDYKKGKPQPKPRLPYAPLSFP